jgi:aspartokinase/homoserine dehydrogenase 1
MEMFQDDFLIGPGGVGKRMVRQMFGKGDMDIKKHENPSRIVGVANSKYFIYEPNGLSLRQIEGFCVGDAWRKPFSIDNVLNEVAAGRGHEQLVFVDTTPSSDMIELYEKVIDKTRWNIVTANKKPLVECSFDTFKRLTRDVNRIGYDCSVMAGSGGVSWIRKNVDLGDPLKSILGVLSGTDAFIMNRVMALRKFSVSLEEAVRKQYAEPDCADDVNGKDAARKLVISARTGGINVDMSRVERQGLVPDGLLVGNYEKVIERMRREVDKKYMKMAKEARGAERVWSFVAEYDGGRLRVGLRALDKAHPLAQVKNNENRMIVTTKDGYRYDSAPVPGAGLDVTARNMRQNLNDLLPGRKVSFS